MKFVTLLGLALGPILVASHSWVDELRVVGGVGEMGGQPGFIRNYEGHFDKTSSYLIANKDQPICRPNQVDYGQKPNYPCLSAPPGSFVQATWLENGHTTNPGDTGNEGYSTDFVYFYGTAKPNPAITFAQIREWTETTKEGRLLGKVPFDDGLCAEKGSEQKPLGKPRWEKGGGGPCKGQFKIPEDAPVGQKYTVYWVWNFSKKVGIKSPDHFEWYSSVMDIDIVDNTGGAKTPDTAGAKKQDDTAGATPTDDTAGATPTGDTAGAQMMRRESQEEGETGETEPKEKSGKVGGEGKLRRSLGKSAKFRMLESL